nr:NACHT domain-containing protein [uncultured Vibrio sp.]
MTEMNSVFSKVLETETAKLICKKLFSKLEATLKSNSSQREADEVLDSVAPIDKSMEQKIFDKVTDRYLTFRTLLSRDNDVFIDEIYHPLKLVSLKDKKCELTLAEHTEFEFPKIACIIGKAGQGKTTILRKMFLNLITNSRGCFPVLITLRKIDWSDKSLNPPKLISNELEEIGINVSEDASSYLLQLGRLRVLFDGFDEIETEHRGFALNIITQTHMKYGSNCIVTTRPGTEVHLYGGEVQNYSLMDLEKADVEKIIQMSPLISENDKEQLLGVINTKPDISNILLTPIVVDVFISTYNSLVAEPTTIIDFYDQLFQTLASTHDRLKVLFERSGKSGLNNKQLEKVFWTASYKLLTQRNDITYRESELSSAFDFSVGKHGLEAVDAHLDVIDKTSLIKQDGLDYSYLHKSIAEFHAAKHVKSLSDEARVGYYNFIIENYRVSHENVLRYLSKIDYELFYITFVNSILNKLKELSDIYDCIDKKVISSDLFLVLFSFDTLSVSVEEKSGEIRVKAQHQLIKREKKIVDLILMLSSILDVSLPVVHSKSVFSSIKDNISKVFLLKNITSGKSYDKDNNVEITHYSPKVEDIIDLNSCKSNAIDNAGLNEFFQSMIELELEVEKQQKIYKERNSLNQFY